MESARFLLCLLLWFASIAGANQRKQGKMPSFPQKRGNFGSTTASEYENWKFLADGNDGVDQVPFCELQMMVGVFWVFLVFGRTFYCLLVPYFSWHFVCHIFLRFF
jgi:hypothetical protein